MAFLERNCVYPADCLEVLRGLPDRSVDLVIADPPYYRMKGDFDFVFQTISDYLEWCLAWAGECHRILKPTGAFYCWGSCQMIDKLSTHVLDKFDWIKRNLIVWNYRTGRPAKATYRNEAEFLWFYSTPCMESTLTPSASRMTRAAKKTDGRTQRGNPAETCGSFRGLCLIIKKQRGIPRRSQRSWRNGCCLQAARRAI